MSIGKILERAEQQAIDSSGKKHAAKVDRPCNGCRMSVWDCYRQMSSCCDDCFHQEVMPARPTMSYAPNPIAGHDQVEIDQEWAQAWSKLSKSQQTAWRLRNRPSREEMTARISTHTIPVQRLDQYLAAGWEMVEAVDDATRWKVQKEVRDRPTFDQIGERLGVSGREAQRLERAADRVLPRRRGGGA